MGPVFLFYVGVVIFMICSATGKLYGMFSLFGKVLQEVIVEELAAVVAVEAEKEEGQGFLNILKPRFPLTPHSSLFRPAGSNVHAIEGEGEHACHRSATVGNRISLQKTGTGFIPLICLDRHVLS